MKIRLIENEINISNISTKSSLFLSILTLPNKFAWKFCKEKKKENREAILQ